MGVTERGNFGSKLGVILATAGSAVGLGNVWRFPYVTGENGGAAFIFIYLVCIFLIGMPIMLCEFIIGRHAQANTARAYTMLAGRGPWRLVGYLGVLTGSLILCYYGVVSGWTLQYVFAALTGGMSGGKDYFEHYFVEFSSNPIKPVLWMVLFVLIAHLIIVRGVQRGIERASKMMMPLLFILLLVLVVCSICLPGSWAGIEFLFKPDFSKVTDKTFLEALGQAFYSLSIAMGCICTYASYFARQTNLTRSAFQIVAIDTMVAILSGLLIFPAALSVGVKPDSGPSLIFITLPNVFEQAFGAVPVVGYVVSVLFYLLLAIAALTSLISLHEVPTSFLSEELRIGRRKAAAIVTACCIVVGALCSLSLAGYSWLQPLGMSLFDCFDKFTANICLTLGGFFTSLFVGWFVPHKVVRNEITNWGTLRVRFYHGFIFAVKYLCPLCMLLIFLHQLGLM